MQTFGSLFSGIGGFDLALERAGFICSWQCEIDKAASGVLVRHWPDVKNIGDVRNVRRDTVEPVDIICGGFPCQDLSIAGKRAGLAGERSGLWYEFARVIEELRPGWVVIENVPGLLSSNGGRDMEIVIRALVELGYGVCWRVLDAQYFGLAQRRKRVFIVGSLGSGRAAEILFERESSPGDTAPSRKAGEKPAYSVRANPSHSGDKGDGGVNTNLIVFGGNNTSGEIDVATAVNASGSRRYDFDSETFVAYPINSQIATRHNRLGERTGLGIRNDGEAMYSLQENQHHAIGTNVGVRRLTPTECERLQGFPDGWTAGQSDSARYRQLGNAVAVPVVEWIARRIYDTRQN